MNCINRRKQQLFANILLHVRIHSRSQLSVLFYGNSTWSHPSPAPWKMPDGKGFLMWKWDNRRMMDEAEMIEVKGGVGASAIVLIHWTLCLVGSYVKIRKIGMWNPCLGIIKSNSSNGVARTPFSCQSHWYNVIVQGSRTFLDSGLKRSGSAKVLWYLFAPLRRVIFLSVVEIIRPKAKGP